MGYINGYNGWGLGLLGPILTFVFWIIIIGLILMVIRWAFGHDHHRMGRHEMHRMMYGVRPEKTPLDILKERYAKGEVNKVEFEEKKRDLMS
ncbi:MAG: SHOCT domain-containing protein [Patescibacteria group bacterium]